MIVTVIRFRLRADGSRHHARAPFLSQFEVYSYGPIVQSTGSQFAVSFHSDGGF